MSRNHLKDQRKYFNNNYYLELPSSYEMRKVMSVCRELKTDENIANVFYAQDSVRVMMKKNDPNDKDEIPKKFDVTNLHEVDKMRKKFLMKNADIPAKQIFNRDYWAKKKQNKIDKKESVNQSVDLKILLREQRIMMEWLRKEEVKICIILVKIQFVSIKPNQLAMNHLFSRNDVLSHSL